MFKKNKWMMILVILLIYIVGTFAACSLINKNDKKSSNSLENSKNSNENNQSVDSDKSNNDLSNNESNLSDNSLTNASQTTDNQNPIGNENENDQGKANLSTKELNVVLDPGHGGSFAGANYFNVSEKDVTLKLGKYIKEYLNTNYPSVNIYLTRVDDTTLSTDVVKDLELRSDFAKEKNANVYVSLHFNASEDHNQQGGCVYISKQKHVYDVSTTFAGCILDELSNLGIKNQGIKTRDSNDMKDENGEPLDYYAVNRHTANRDIPGIIVEHCFLDNEKDFEFIDSDDDLRKLAEADAKGIINALAECFD